MGGPEPGSLDAAGLAAGCRERGWTGGLSGLVATLAELLPGLRFEHVLSRGGWHRIGGVVDGSHARVADRLDRWAERESGGDVAALLDRYGDAGYLATRLRGTAHTLTASTGDGAADFVQLEIEELQEVVERPLVDPESPPADLGELVDPLEAKHLEPAPIGPPRWEFRRVLRVPEWLDRRPVSYGGDAALARFFADWERSSAGAQQRLCRHWALALREWRDTAGVVQLSGKPIPARRFVDDLRRVPATLRGIELSSRLQAFDRRAGYPFAWYFHMLGTTDVCFEVGEAALADREAGFAYLPDRDLAILEAWSVARYTP